MVLALAVTEALTQPVDLAGHRGCRPLDAAAGLQSIYSLHGTSIPRDPRLAESLKRDSRALEAAARNFAVPARSGQIVSGWRARSVVVRLLADGLSGLWIDVMDPTASEAGARIVTSGLLR